MEENSKFLNFHKIYGLLPNQSKKTQFWLILFLVLIAALLETVSISSIIPILGAIVNTDIKSNYPFLAPLIDLIGESNQLEFIKISVAFFICLYFLKFLFMIFLTYFQGKFIYETQSELTQKIFKEYLNRDLTFHINHNSSELIRNSTTEIASYNGALGSLLRFITESTITIGVIVMLIYADPIPAIIMISMIGLFNIFFYAFTKNHIISWGIDRQKMDGRILKFIQQGLNGIKESKVLGLQHFFFYSFKKPVEIKAKLNVKQHILQDFPRLALELLLITSVGILIFSVIFQGDDIKRIVPMIGMFSIAAFRLMPSSGKIIAAVQKIQFNHSAVDVLFSEFSNSITNKSSEKKNSTFYQKHKDSIILSGVCYKYNSSKNDILKNVNLEIELNKTYGIIGESGSGKSTLINLLLGLIYPNKGKIFFPEELKNKKNKFGYVPQNIFLIDDSIKNNIALGVPEKDINIENLQQAIKLAQLDEFLKALPDSYNTHVGENGTRISGGQKQRIGIARALYRNPRILIFDEPTSSLDKNTELNIVKTINDLHGTRTIIIVSHNEEPLRECDHIFDINTGIIK